MAWARQVALWGLAGLLVLGIWPSRLGGSTTFVVVEGNSMEPTYQSGDVVVARRQAHYAPGDVVVFRVHLEARPGTSMLVVHRILSISPSGEVVTQGDNRATPDGFPTTTADIVGRTRWRVPRGALVLALASQWWVLGALAGLLVAASLWPSVAKDRGEGGADPLADPSVAPAGHSTT